MIHSYGEKNVMEKAIIFGGGCALALATERGTVLFRGMVAAPG